VVLQAGGGRHLEPVLQLDPAAQVAVLQAGRPDVGQGVGEGLLVIQPRASSMARPAQPIAASER
jgi:hypothetical protein